MEKDLVEGKLGDVGSYDVEFKDGKLVAKVEAKFAVGNAVVSLEIGAEQVLDAIAKAIPGAVDDAVISIIKGALLK